MSEQVQAPGPGAAIIRGDDMGRELQVVRSEGDIESGASLLRSLDPAKPDGMRLLDLWAWNDDGENRLQLLLGDGLRLRWHSMPLPESGAYRGFGHLSPAAAWLETDLSTTNVVLPMPPGDPNPDRALRAFPVEPLRDARGEGLFTIPFGPVRSGIVESMRYDVATAGEDMIRVAVRPGSKRRALEHRLTELPVGLAPIVAERIAGMYSASVAAAVSRAVESAAGVDVGPDAERIRVALVELERLFNHLDAIMKLCDDASLSVGVAQVAMLKERVLRLLAALTGHRYARGMVVLGGVRSGLDLSLLRQAVDRLARDLHRVQRQLLRTNSLLDRFQRTGAVTREVAAALATAGPAARGSGLPWDARHERPWAAYRELDFRPVVMDDTDVMARFEVRLAEMRDSIRMLDTLAEHAAPVPLPVGAEPEAGAYGVGTVETPEGEWIVCAEMGEQGRLRHCRVRPASILNFACFEVACRGWVLTDFAFIEHSFGLSIAGRDR